MTSSRETPSSMADCAREQATIDAKHRSTCERASLSIASGLPRAGSGTHVRLKFVHPISNLRCIRRRSVCFAISGRSPGALRTSGYRLAERSEATSSARHAGTHSRETPTHEACLYLVVRGKLFRVLGDVGSDLVITDPGTDLVITQSLSRI